MKEILLLLKQKYPNDTEFGKKMREFLSDENVLETLDIISKDMPNKEIISVKNTYNI